MSAPIALAVIDFWFAEAAQPLWFRSTPEFDTAIRERFAAVWQSARSGELSYWGGSAQGALALVIVLDQFPLNMFRGLPAAFASEQQARATAADAVARGFDSELDADGKMFLYLPFTHSENLADQDRGVALYAAAGLKDQLRWAEHHRSVIRRFGRFPHRNGILGRPSTADELRYLASAEAFHG
jgi:uncharacterized protein (DUF924 family)